MAKRYVVTGAAGHLGSTILRLLRGGEDEVIALILPGSKPEVEDQNIRYVYGDVRRREALEPLFRDNTGKDTVVIHAAGIVSISTEIPPEMYAVNVEGTKNMLQISREHGVERFVYVSSVHAIPELPKPSVIQETATFSPELVTGGYAKTKAEASRAVMDAARGGFPAMIVHPSGIIGPYDRGRNHLLQLVTDYIGGRLPVCVAGGYDFVDVRDAAKGCLLAAEKGTAGQCYILSGHYLTIRELLTEVGRYCGRKPPLLVPGSFAWLAAPCIEWHAGKLGTRPLYTRYSLNTLTSNGNFSCEKAEKALGYHSREIESTIRDMTLWLLGQE